MKIKCSQKYKFHIKKNCNVFLDYSFFALENGIYEYRNVEEIKFKKQDLRVFYSIFLNYKYVVL